MTACNVSEMCSQPAAYERSRPRDAGPVEEEASSAGSQSSVDASEESELDRPADSERVSDADSVLDA